MNPLLRFIAAGLEFLSAMVVAVNAGNQMSQAWDEMKEENGSDMPEDVVDIRECEDWFEGDCT